MKETKDLRKAIEKTALSTLLLNAVFDSDGDLYDEPCIVDKRKYNNYLKAVEIATRLKERGKCDFKADDIQKAHMLHSINIKWKISDEFYMCIDSEILEDVKLLLEYSDECLIHTDEATVWSLFSTVYVPVNEVDKK